MLAYTFYEFDNRVRRYAEALAARGDQVDVIALAGDSGPWQAEQIRGVTLYRIQQRDFKERSKWSYARRLLRFVWVSSWFLRRRQKQVGYDVVHVHNMPDFLAFAAWYPKWKGAAVILDIHDIMPELFANKFDSNDPGTYARLLQRVEKASADFADHVIVSNHLWYETFTSRSVPKSRASVFINHVDQSIFYRRARARNDGKYIILFPGSFGWHQGLDLAIEAMVKVREKIPNAELHLYGGGGGTEGDLKLLAENLGLAECVKFCGSRPLDEIADVIANADLGVVPKRADSFGNEAYSTKIMEFMSQGVPVVVSRTKIDSYYFTDGLVRFFPSGDTAGLAAAILEVAQDRQLRDALVANGREYADRNSWDAKKHEYFALVDGLSARKPRIQDGGLGPGQEALPKAHSDAATKAMAGV
jgi:glycosyltransferase involved in cell wall biosynthesis